MKKNHRIRKSNVNFFVKPLIPVFLFTLIIICCDRKQDTVERKNDIESLSPNISISNSLQNTSQTEIQMGTVKPGHKNASNNVGVSDNHLIKNSVNTFSMGLDIDYMPLNELNSYVDKAINEASISQLQSLLQKLNSSQQYRLAFTVATNIVTKYNNESDELKYALSISEALQTGNSVLRSNSQGGNANEVYLIAEKYISSLELLLNKLNDNKQIIEWENSLNSYAGISLQTKNSGDEIIELIKRSDKALKGMTFHDGFDFVERTKSDLYYKLAGYIISAKDSSLPSFSDEGLRKMSDYAEKLSPELKVPMFRNLPKNIIVSDSLLKPTMLKALKKYNK